MAIYRQINITFWQDDFVLELTPEEKFFYLYLMTNSKTTQCGIYELPKKIIQFETGYNSDTVDKLINRFVEYGKIMYSNDTKEVFMLNWIKYNYSTSPKVQTCISNELKTVKEPAFIDVFNKLLIQYGYSIDTVCKGVRNNNKNNNKNNNNNNNKNKNNNKHICSLYSSHFDTFYNLYPRKVNKKKSQEKYYSILKQSKNPEETANDILEGLKRYIDFWERDKTELQFIPHPTTWLNGERWNDDLKQSNKKSRLDVLNELYQEAANE